MVSDVRVDGLKNRISQIPEEHWRLKCSRQLQIVKMHLCHYLSHHLIFADWLRELHRELWLYSSTTTERFGEDNFDVFHSYRIGFSAR